MRICRLRSVACLFLQSLTQFKFGNLMKILVTGAAGFLGFRLTEWLLESGHVVLGVDNFLSGEAKRFGLLKKKFGEKFTGLEFDVCNSMLEMPQIVGVEAIYHMACPASPKDYFAVPLQTLWICAQGTRNVLNVAARTAAKLILASSSEVYGEIESESLKETEFGAVNMFGNRACYQEGKRFAEVLALNYQRAYGFPLLIGRIFNVYGPGMRLSDGRVVAEFIRAALEGRKMPVFGDGKQTRSFCFIDDMVSILADCLTITENVGAVNLGRDEEISIGKLAAIVEKVAGTSRGIEYLSSEFEDNRRRKPDISKLIRLFGERKFIGIEEGIRLSYEFERKLQGLNCLN